MAKFIVRDPHGVYKDQEIDVPFGLPPASIRRGQSVGEAKTTVVRILAIEAMYGCPVSEVDPKHVRDMLRSVTIEEVPE